MNYRLVITERALADLRAIRDYIGKRSPLNSEKFLSKILDQFDVIQQSPESFCVAPENDLVPYTLHQFIVKPYRILYRVQKQRIEILHVRHGAREPATEDDLA